MNDEGQKPKIKEALAVLRAAFHQGKSMDNIQYDTISYALKAAEKEIERLEVCCVEIHNRNRRLEDISCDQQRRLKTMGGEK